MLPPQPQRVMLMNDQPSGVLPDPAVAADDTPLSKLTTTQVFALSPEAFTPETVAEAAARLAPILARYRKARQDEATLRETAAAIKKTNATAAKAKAKKKAKAAPVPLDQPFDRLIGDK